MGKFLKFIQMHHNDDDIQPVIARVHSSFHRHNASQTISKRQKEWAKLRGAVKCAVLLGSLRENKNENKKLKEEHQQIMRPRAESVHVRRSASAQARVSVS